jgi:nitrite reductase/ring-hydroxylating ferredoxin subunit
VARKNPLLDRWPAHWPVRPFAEDAWAAQEPTYRDASPALIEAAVKRATARPSGNWFVFAASSEVKPDKPFGITVGGREIVAWRDTDGTLLAGGGACPHLGAPLKDAKVDCGGLVCRWHGLRLDARGGYGWSTLPAHDDGVLAWVRLDDVGTETPTDAPIVPVRPEGTRLDAVATVVGTCEPEDVVANRLDPWHGAWFHPYSFARLRVTGAPRDLDVAEQDDRFLVDVTFRLAGRWGVPVKAEFTCPGPRVVVMTITEGEGAGSVVETHATPLGPGPDGLPRTAVIEATIATSPRPGFALATRAAPMLRPMMRRTAARLWRDDLAYAERLYALRAKGN